MSINKLETDKFGKIRGRCYLCKECKAYTLPPHQSERGISCDYCEHVPILHELIVQLKKCNCGKCPEYQSDDENYFSYVKCGYCDCSAESHHGYQEVLKNEEEIKRRFQNTKQILYLSPSTANKVQPQSPTPHATQTFVATPAQQTNSTHSCQPPMPSPSLNQNPNPSPNTMASPFSPSYQPMANQQVRVVRPTYPNNQGQYSNMPNSQMPTQNMSHYGPNMSYPPASPPNMGPSNNVPYHHQYGDTNPHQQGGGMQQGGGIQQAHMNPAHGYPNNAFSAQKGSTASIPNMEKCKNKDCNRSRRKKEDGTGYYDFCGKGCATKN